MASLSYEVMTFLIVYCLVVSKPVFQCG